MDNDDLPIGRVLDRREAVKLIAMTGAAVMVGCNRGTAATSDSQVAAAGGVASPAAARPLPGCLVRPELTEGPFFVDNQLDRSDIRSDPSSKATAPGKPLDITFNVSQVSRGQCVPIAGAIVDVWHCDAYGVYHGVDDRTTGSNAQGQKLLRGYQKTDAKGVARFTTIYPGWYRGRTVHIHFKIRAPWAPGAQVTDATKQYDFTSQLFFDDSLSDKVYAASPYNSKGARDRRNESDGIFRQSGDSLLLKVTESGSAYAANFDIGLDLSDAGVGAEDRMGRPGGPPPPRR
jgi:protocatechuate 3,4-dioxygenase beta subunit